MIVEEGCNYRDTRDCAKGNIEGTNRSKREACQCLYENINHFQLWLSIRAIEKCDAVYSSFIDITKEIRNAKNAHSFLNV